MDIKARIRNEMLLKVDLCATGTRIEKGALDGEVFRENVNCLFEWNTEDPPPGDKIPADIVFPEGTIAKLNYNPKSPYTIRKENGQLSLERHGNFLSTIRFGERPDFYDKVTSEGIPMYRIVPLIGECGFLVCLSTTCNYFTTGDECKFCNMNPALSKGDHQALLAPKMADQVAEVMEAMIDEGIEPCFTISSGSLPEKIYCEAVIRIIQAIEKRPQCAHVIPRLMCQMEVPKDLSWLDRLYEHGVRRVDMNIEVWDPDMFRFICPGKSKRIGREHWLRGLRYAQKLFGTPYVYTGIVAGPEPKKTLYEATDELTEMGIWPLITPWWTQGGTQFDGHRPPHPEWCLEVTEKCVDRIVERIPQFMDEAFFYWFMGGCYRCDDVVIMPDELRVRHNGLKKVFPKEARQAQATLN